MENKIYSFKNSFKDILEQNGIKQSEVANQCNISRQAVNDYIHGRNTPSLETLRIICKIFDLSADEILCLNEYNETLMTTATNNLHGSNNVIGTIVNGSNNGNIATKINIKK